MLQGPSIGRTVSLAAALLGLLLATPHSPAQEPAGPPERPFDGETLAGWEGDPRFWRVEDGVLIGESTPENPCETTTYLFWTGGELADFDLRLEVRLSAGNSGVQVRSARGPGLEVLGYQADLDVANDWTGGLYETEGRGVTVRRGQRVTYGSDGGRTVEALESRQALPGLASGRWSRLRVVGQGPRLAVEVDGVLISELVDRHPDLARRRGVLALQLHQGAPMRVEFRDLRLVHLEPVPEEPEEPSSARSMVPRWIWPRPQASEGERAWLFGELELEAAPTAARLEGSCDNGMQVRVNGKAVLAGDDWTRPVFVDVTSALRAGRNTIAVAARNAEGPAALQLALVWTGADGVERRRVTDRTWRATREAPEGWELDGFDPSGLAPAVELAPLGSGTWGTLPAPVPPPRDDALPAEELELAEGYAAELLYSVPRAMQGSWVALTIDEQGRAIASHERGGLYRVTPPAAPGAAVQVELLDDTLGGAQGLLALERDLYVVAQPRGPHPCGLYRLRDTDVDGRYEPPELLRALDGAGEHGPHAILRDGPHGDRLLLVAGNHVRLPDDVVRSRVPRAWAEDQLLPRRDDPGGHAVGVMAPGGWVASLDRDGGDLELVACGLRNVYDVAFGPEGELFAYDADMEWDAGLAWYRPPRVLHLVDGADFGWRHGSGKWPADWPDTLPSVVDTDLSSPTGVLYGAALRGFAGRERAALLIADWAYGRILAVDLEPRGASWSGSVRPFVSGRPLPVTDLAAGPDGCLYFITGGRGAQSGLYRVRWTGDPSSPATVDATALGRGDVAERRTRSRLEALRAEPGSQGLAEAWPWLASPDPFLRHAARLVLESRAPEGWIERLAVETRPRAVAQGVVSLAHAGDATQARAATRRVLDLPLEQLDAGSTVDLLRALALVELRLGGVPEPERGELRARLEGLFPCGRERVDRELLRWLVRLESARVVAPAVAWLERASRSEEATHVAFTLVEARVGWDDGLRARYLDWIDAAPTRWSGGASFRGYLERLADDAYTRLGLDRPRPAPGASSASLRPRPFVRAWTYADLVPQLARTDSGRSFERGREAFVAAQCAACHQVRGQGGRTGPDLTGAGARFRPVEVLESILEPSRVISDQYQDLELLTHGDELLVGRLAGEDPEGLWLRLAPPEEVEVLVEHGEVARRRLHPLSRMPEGLLDVLELDEALDLLAFVLAGGEPDDPRFR